MKKTSTLEELTKIAKAYEQLRTQEGEHQQQVLPNGRQVRPRASVIDSILGYSKALRIVESGNLGQQELVLN